MGFEVMLNPVVFALKPFCDFFLHSLRKDFHNMRIKEFIDKLDAFFERDDMQGAGEHLRFSRKEAEAENDKQFLLTVLNEMMGYYRKTREEERGLESVFSGLSLVKELHFEEKAVGATTMLNAATTLKAFGRASEAVIYYESASLIYDKLFLPYDVRIAGLCNNYALTLVDLENYSAAEEKYKKALSILNKYDDKLTDIANTYVNMAHLYDAMGNYEKIEECLDSAYSVLQDDKNRNGYYAYTCRKCAPSFGYFGYFEVEKELNERADKIYEGNRAVF